MEVPVPKIMLALKGLLLYRAKAYRLNENPSKAAISGRMVCILNINPIDNIMFFIGEGACL